MTAGSTAVMRSVHVGTTISLISNVTAPAMLRLRPSDAPIEHESLVVHGPHGECEATTLVDDLVHTQLVDRVLLPAGTSTITYDATVLFEDRTDPVAPGARAPRLDALEPREWWWLQPTRYCPSDLFAAEAWARFGVGIDDRNPATWEHVQTICDTVNASMAFQYGSSTSFTTAFHAWESKIGVCRDFNHIAVSFCRALNVPARYVFGYIPDIDVPVNPAPQDFCAWFEVLLDGEWWTMDARVNERRKGRVVIARGRDAADIPMISNFGLITLAGFEVRAREALGDIASSELAEIGVVR